MIISFILLVFLFFLSAAFSGAETILFSLSTVQRERIRARNARHYQQIEKCLASPAPLLSTLLVGNTLVNFAIATLGYSIFTSLMPGYGAFVAVPVITILLLFLGEIMPKRLGLVYAEKAAPMAATFLIVVRALLRPFNAAFSFSTRAFTSAIVRERRALSDTELVSVLEVAAERGDFVLEDTEMITGVLRLSDLHANDEMTPRVDIEGIDSDTSESEQLSLIASTHYHYLPIYRRSPDAIEAVYNVRDKTKEEPLFIPEQMSLDDLLVIFRKSGKAFAVVTDEYGGTAGIITLDDVMEIVMGPKVFADKKAEPQINQVSKNVWIVDARASLDEINRSLDIELEAEDVDRLAGWVAFYAERIPHVGQQIEAQGCRATVLRRRKHRVTSVRLEVLTRPKTSSDDELIAETDEQVEKIEEENC